MKRKLIISVKNKTTSEKYFRRYLKIAPLSVSLCRSIEAKNFATVAMKHPILDIGCGFGEFAQVFFKDPVDMGVDNSALDLKAAKKVNKYKNLVLADARSLPFLDKSYQTVMSVSTIEHIKNPDKVFKEAYRVLKPNGMLVISVETNKVDKNSFYRQVLRKFNFHFLDNLYAKAFNTIFHRYTIISKEEWEKKIKNAGFVIEQSREIVSPKIIKFFEIFFISAWPSQILKPVLGRRIMWRPRFMIDFLTNVFLKYVDEEAEGTVLFLVARKPQVKKV